MLAYTTALADGKIALHAAAAVNVAAPALAKALAELATVSECTGADTAAWRRTTGLAKSHWVDALCTAMQGETTHFMCGRPARITMTGRGRRP